MKPKLFIGTAFFLLLVTLITNPFDDGTRNRKTPTNRHVDAGNRTQGSTLQTGIASRPRQEVTVTPLSGINESETEANQGQEDLSADSVQNNAQNGEGVLAEALTETNAISAPPSTEPENDLTAIFGDVPYVVISASIVENVAVTETENNTLSSKERDALIDRWRSSGAEFTEIPPLAGRVGDVGWLESWKERPDAPRTARADQVTIDEWRDRDQYRNLPSGYVVVLNFSEENGCQVAPRRWATQALSLGPDGNVRAGETLMIPQPNENGGAYILVTCASSSGWIPQSVTKSERLNTPSEPRAF